MSQLMTFFEMQKRYKKKEDPFDLIIEKWIRILQFLDIASTISDFQELFRAANVAVPFCLKYQIKGCLGCPLGQICGRGKGVKILKVMKPIQTHLLAVLAGNRLPKETLISEIDGLLTELRMLKPESKELGH